MYKIVTLSLTLHRPLVGSMTSSRLSHSVHHQEVQVPGRMMRASTCPLLQYILIRFPMGAYNQLLFTALEYYIPRSQCKDKRNLWVCLNHPPLRFLANLAVNSAIHLYMSRQSMKARRPLPSRILCKKK